MSLGFDPNRFKKMREVHELYKATNSLTEKLLRCGTDAASDYVPQECFSSRGFTVALKPTPGNYMDYFMHDMLVKHHLAEDDTGATIGDVSSTAFSGSFVDAHLDAAELALPLRVEGDAWDIGGRTGNPAGDKQRLAAMWNPHTDFSKNVKGDGTVKSKFRETSLFYQHNDTKDTCQDKARSYVEPSGDIGMIFLAMMLHSRHLAKDAHRAVIEKFDTLFGGRDDAERIAESISPNIEETRFVESFIANPTSQALATRTLASDVLEDKDGGGLVFPECVASGKCGVFSRNLQTTGCSDIKRDERHECEAQFDAANTCQTRLLVDKGTVVDEMCPLTGNCWMLGRLKLRRSPEVHEVEKNGMGWEVGKYRYDHGGPKAGELSVPQKDSDPRPISANPYHYYQLPNVFTGADHATVEKEIIWDEQGLKTDTRLPSYERAIFLHNDGITLASDVRRFGTVGEDKFGSGNASAGTQKMEVFVATGSPLTPENCLAAAISMFGDTVVRSRNYLQVDSNGAGAWFAIPLSRPRAWGEGRVERVLTAPFAQLVRGPLRLLGAVGWRLGCALEP